mmetsp:Transcript_15396/g.20680  ORF Transcript_15396/g.20680 Transcript_15396/m.20680 type:complete len:247 (-) Transcript_15396:347-1087(-)|eukprot:CAMPEP_0185763300 /NCGR_PEP_ID=MMETSP1174-20130828/22240_1 /TAXON_ID=35687 /ORGANISM="Dictyocha speculum, Strain CCMP1381" /LENGTH=246 /DNA_ID=CAMNT_0028445347 /DNA_START=22 /DNA_END=762 /DNA_ORIENTATION=-
MDASSAVSNHPVLLHKITQMRKAETDPREFRRLLREVTFKIGYEATSRLSTETLEITTPMGRCEGFKISNSIAIVPILRAGLGMVDPMLEMLPNASVHHIGMYRQKASLLPVLYYNRLPADNVSDVSFVLDPMIATGSTITVVVSLLKKWGTKKIVVVATLASRVGYEKLTKEHPDVAVHVGCIDDTLSDDGMILPGLGDAGDRQFWTPVLAEDEIMLPGTGRKRADSEAFDQSGGRLPDKKPRNA